MKKIIIWAPRYLVIAYMLLLASFGLDAFREEGSFLHRLGDFGMHLMPVLVVLVFLLVAWRYRLIGGLFFIILGQVFTIYYGSHKSASLFMLISLPLLLAGVLFIVSHRYATEKVFDGDI